MLTWALRLIATLPMRKSTDPAALIAAYRVAVAGFDPRDVMRAVVKTLQGGRSHPFAPSPPELADRVSWEVKLREFRGEADPGPWLPPGDDRALAIWAADFRERCKGMPCDSMDMQIHIAIREGRDEDARRLTHLREMIGD